jgi:hypothetical protein
VPFPVTSLAGFDITVGGKVLLAIPLRPGPPRDAAGPRFRAVTNQGPPSGGRAGLRHVTHSQ